MCGVSRGVVAVRSRSRRHGRRSVVVGVGHVGRRRGIVGVVHVCDSRAMVQRRKLMSRVVEERREWGSGHGRLFTVASANRRECDVASQRWMVVLSRRERERKVDSVCRTLVGLVSQEYGLLEGSTMRS